MASKRAEAIMQEREAREQADVLEAILERVIRIEAKLDQFFTATLEEVDGDAGEGHFVLIANGSADPEHISAVDEKSADEPQSDGKAGKSGKGK